MNTYKVGQRVIGRHSRRLGSVVSVHSAGPSILFDGDESGPHIMHGELHVEPLGAAEDQPQPACPPAKANWSATWAQRNRKMGAAERPRQGEPACFREPCSRCGGAVSKDERGDLFCDCPDDPAPEVQRAQSVSLRERMRMHCATRYQDDAALGAMFAEWHRTEGTPAPNTAAAVAELEAMGEWLDGDYTVITRREARMWSRRALAYLQPTTEPPGGDKESER